MGGVLQGRQCQAGLQAALSIAYEPDIHIFAHENVCSAISRVWNGLGMRLSDGRHSERGESEKNVSGNAQTSLRVNENGLCIHGGTINRPADSTYVRADSAYPLYRVVSMQKPECLRIRQREVASFPWYQLQSCPLVLRLQKRAAALADTRVSARNDTLRS
ncbi:hypothetical protein CYLTODRAFT_427266 [Cylindrobasidium torrendii FP15055 ss-10]|uniref:Uncharacterized protein n=1 Tax=Cylindrobasidium torrendii FP15055 ss-10 TaxID=1314674 RepID=A0A0D7AUP1_9AGAR|nr:hypothetical protein CYLTODRAFT_427266 [Cylindrobasidium torrendii FP15055 ss-10]